MFTSTIKRAIGAAALVAAMFVSQAASAATGLAGSYYKTGSTNITTLAEAESWILTHAPSATFVSTQVCYPACHQVAPVSQTLTQWLGGNATNISASAASITDIDHHIVVLEGFITFATGGTKTFELRSDDGSSLKVGGYILTSDGVHALSDVTGSQNFAAGTYAIRILQFEVAGESGLTLKVNGSPAQTYTHFPPVPEPGTWAMMIGGLALVGFAMRCRRAVVVSFA